MLSTQGVLSFIQDTEKYPLHIDLDPLNSSFDYDFQNNLSSFLY
jgi:hypothetical protein